MSDAPGGSLTLNNIKLIMQQCSEIIVQRGGYLEADTWRRITHISEFVIPDGRALKYGEILTPVRMIILFRDSLSAIILL